MGEVARFALTGRKRPRRRWTLAEKLAIVEAAKTSGDPVSVVARRHGMNANHLFNWLQRDRDGTLDRAALSVESGGPMDFIDLGVVGETTAPARPVAISGAGSVGIATTAPPLLFYVNGGGGGNQAWSSSSDARLKANVREITGALGMIDRLRGVRFDWRPPAAREIGKDLELPVSQPQFRFIAQEVEKVAPEAVSAPRAGPDGVYGVKEESLVPILVEAVKEQQAEIKELRAELAALRAQR